MSDRAPAWQRAAMTAAFAYELVALWSPLPTITNLVHRRPWLAGPVVGALSVHFHPQEVAR